ncbi:MAG: hypothetical protein HQM16_19110 [Deltaproteobacteria bacterium]|nr:hypothetical protein [Deltaproteobacteria bacterium]
MSRSAHPDVTHSFSASGLAFASGVLAAPFAHADGLADAAVSVGNAVVDMGLVVGILFAGLMILDNKYNGPKKNKGWICGGQQSTYNIPGVLEEGVFPLPVKRGDLLRFRTKMGYTYEIYYDGSCDDSLYFYDADGSRYIIARNHVIMDSVEILGRYPAEGDPVALYYRPKECEYGLTFVGAEEDSLTFRNSQGHEFTFSQSEISNLEAVSPVLGRRIRIASIRGNYREGYVEQETMTTFTIRHHDGSWQTLSKCQMDYRTLRYLDSKPVASRVMEALYPHGPMNSHVRQGNAGDCYLLAGLHGLKQIVSFAEVVRKQIQRGQKNGIKGYWVIFAKYPDNAQFVSDEELAPEKHGSDLAIPEKKLMAKGNLGDNLIEWAYGKLRRELTTKRTYFDDIELLHGGYGHHFLEDLTGWKRAVVSSAEEEDFIAPIRDKPESHRPKMTEAFHCAGVTGSLVFATSPHRVKSRLNQWLVEKAINPSRLILTANTPIIEGEEYVGRGNMFKTRHAHSIVDVEIDPRTRAVKTVTVADPHDTSRPRRLTMDEFEWTFTQVTINLVNVPAD